MVIEFTKDRSVVHDDADKCVLTGLRSSDYCYMLEKLQICYSMPCNITEISHQKYGHLNFKKLMKLVEIGVVRGLPKLMQK